MVKHDANLYQEASHLLDYNAKAGVFTWKEARGSCKKGSIAGNTSGGYIRISLHGRNIKAHRLAWYMFHNTVPEEVDHINGIRDDNRIVNLRACTHSQNMMNRKKHHNNKSGHPGVHYHKGKKRWIARVKVNGKRIGLGAYKFKKDAINARKVAVAKYYKEFAYDHDKKKQKETRKWQA